MLLSAARATCQSSNKLGYSAGSAKDSAAFGFTFQQKFHKNVRESRNTKILVRTDAFNNIITLFKSFFQIPTMSETLLGRYDLAISAASGIRLLHG
jgi:hypothetical protein